MKLIVCSVLADGTAQVNAVNDPGRAFARFRRDWGQAFLPVAGVCCDPDVFRRVSGLVLPSRLPLGTAASLFSRVPLDPVLVPAVSRHLKTEAAAGRLLRLWAEATEVAQAV